MCAREIDAATLVELAVDAAPGGLLLVDPQGVIVLVNREIERLFGYSRDDLLGQRVELLVPESDRVLHRSHRAHYAEAPERRPMGAGRYLAGRRKDGSPVHVEIGLSPVATPSGLHTLASVIDIGGPQQPEARQPRATGDELAFERHAAHLISRLIDAGAPELDAVIAEALGSIGAAFAVDDCSLCRLHTTGEPFDAIGWTAPGAGAPRVRVACGAAFPWATARVLAGGLAELSMGAEVPSEADRAGLDELGIKSALVLPLSVEGLVVGALGLHRLADARPWPEPLKRRAMVIASVCAQLLARRQRDEAMQQAVNQIQRLKDELHAENVALRREVRRQALSGSVVGKSAAVGQVLDQIHQVAATASTVLLLGETGVGKELFATQIHELGPRHQRPMVRVNCAAIPATLIESELFGREKGAFTGALARQVGRFELAHGSTIFLDEIGDLPADIQVKLLRVLENGVIERLGSPQPIRVDVRVVAATHRDLERLVADGSFRADLYYRLNVFPIRIPALRDRTEDIPLLVWRFVEELSRTLGKRIDAVAEHSLAALMHYSWPGNIRELRNLVERAMIAATGPKLTIPLPVSSPAAARRSSKLIDVEREHIRGVLEAAGWRIRGPGGAAERLGLKPTTLETRMARLSLKRPALRN